MRISKKFNISRNKGGVKGAVGTLLRALWLKNILRSHNLNILGPHTNSE